MFKKIILLFSLSLWIFFVNFTYATATTTDALDTVLWANPSAKNYQIITKNELKDSDVQGTVQKTTELLLKLTVIIWVAVFLFGGIRFMMSMWDDSKAKKIRDNLIISILGFIIAFWAWIILQLILSAGTTISHI